ncbi:MAG: DUF302 domain-containing protein [Bacteroidota bacterium]
MNLKNVVCIGMLLLASASFGQNLSIYKSRRDVRETTLAIVKMIQDRGLQFLDTVSYENVARERGVDVGPTKVVTFDSSDLTNELITCQQTAALDLPLKILVWEENEDVYIGFINPTDMEKRFMLNNCTDTVDALNRLMIRLVTDVMRAM